jgi:hypothetical protein
MPNTIKNHQLDFLFGVEGPFFDFFFAFFSAFSRKKRFKIYVIDVKTRRAAWTVRLRYSQLLHFHLELAKRKPNAPEFPPKICFNAQRRFIELNEYINAIVNARWANGILQNRFDRHLTGFFIVFIVFFSCFSRRPPRQLETRFTAMASILPKQTRRRCNSIRSTQCTAAIHPCITQKPPHKPCAHTRVFGVFSVATRFTSASINDFR